MCSERGTFYLREKKSEMEVQQAREQDRGQMSKSYMKSVALETPTLLPSTAQLHGLMIGANTLITISHISLDKNLFYFKSHQLWI